jgi:hypothetical protein
MANLMKTKMRVYEDKSKGMRVNEGEMRMLLDSCINFLATLFRPY